VRSGREPRAWRAGLAVVAALALAPRSAAAQVVAHAKPAFSVERLTPAPGALTFLGVEEADVLPAHRWAFSLSAWRAARPIVLRELDSGEVALVPVRARYGQELAVGYGLGARYQLGLAVPFAEQTGDRLQGIGLAEQDLQHLVAGDLRVHGRVRMIGRAGEPGLAVGMAAALVVPTGDDGDFAGEESWSGTWSARLGWRDDDVELVGGFGVRLRAEEVVLLSPARPHANEFTVDAGVAVRLSALGVEVGAPGQLWGLAELQAVYGDDSGKGATGPSPGEARIGVRAHVAHCWTAAFAAGGGFTPDEIGSPAWRVVGQLAFHQAPIHDLDGDGLLDRQDACWRDREDRDGYQDWDGCPELDDDADGVLDREDACPREPEDRDGYRDNDGCPDDEERMTPQAPAPPTAPVTAPAVTPPLDE